MQLGGSCLLSYVSVPQVVARDDDQGANSQLSYMLVGGSAAFTLSASGELRVTQNLDREAEALFVLMITASDKGACPFTQCCGGPVMKVRVPSPNVVVQQQILGMFRQTSGPCAGDMSLLPGLGWGTAATL